jgi:hypothetical protein
MTDTPPTCERCGLDQRQSRSCIVQPDAIRFGMEAPGEPGSVAALATRCPDCNTPRGGYHHQRCSYEQRRQP